MIWKILSILALILPVCAVVLGLLCWRYPPAGPTWAFGFRSRRARAGDAAWAFAQEWAGKSWFLGGLAMLMTTLLISAKQKETPLDAMLPAFLKLVAVQIGLVLVLVVVLNVLLLVKFDRFGRRRKGKDKSTGKTRRTSGEEPAPEDPEEGYDTDDGYGDVYGPEDEGDTGYAPGEPEEDDGYGYDEYEDSYDGDDRAYDEDGWEDVLPEPEE